MAEGVRRSQQGYSLPHLSPKKSSLQAWEAGPAAGRNWARLHPMHIAGSAWLPAL